MNINKWDKSKYSYVLKMYQAPSKFFLFAPSTQALVLTAFLWPLTVLPKLNTAFPECAGKFLPFEKSSD